MWLQIPPLQEPEPILSVQNDYYFNYLHFDSRPEILGETPSCHHKSINTLQKVREKIQKSTTDNLLSHSSSFHAQYRRTRRSMWAGLAYARPSGHLIGYSWAWGLRQVWTRRGAGPFSVRESVSPTPIPPPFSFLYRPLFNETKERTPPPSRAAWSGA